MPIVVGAHAAPASPVADLNVAFTEFSGPSAIGNNNLNDDGSLYWVYEGQGVWMGEAVHSWFLAWDPLRELTATGTITFDRPIVSLLGTRSLLLGSAYLGSPSVTYDYSNLAVGLENGDILNTSFSGSVLSVSWTAAIPGDHARILTQVPEPATWSLVLGGLVAIGLLSGRRIAER